MIPVSYSECVSVRSDSVQEQSCVSYCDLESPRRSKSCVRLEQRLSPIAFRDSIVCYRDCSRKRYRSTTRYEFRVKPVNYRETCYVLPKTAVNTFVSFLDYNVDGQSKWYKTSVSMQPRSYSSSLTHRVSGYGENEAVTSDGESDVFSPAPDSDPYCRINGGHVSTGDVTSCDRLRSSVSDGDKDENMNYKNAAKDNVEISEHYRIKLVVGGGPVGGRNMVNRNGQRSWHPPVGVTDGSVYTNGDIDNDNISLDDGMEM